MSRKISIAIVLFLALVIDIKSQCPEGDITLFDMDDVEEFIELYGDCTSFPQWLRVIGISEISDLGFLSNVQEVGDLLIIADCPNLTSLNGLNSLTSAGQVWISRNAQLQDLTGLENLENTDFLRIEDGFGSEPPMQLSSLAGLDKLTSLDGLYLSRLRALTDLSGLESLVTVNGDVWISDVGQGQITCPNSIATITGSLFVSPNPQVESCTIQGFNALRSVGTIDFGTFGDNWSHIEVTVTATQGLTQILGDANLQALEHIDLSNLETVKGNLQLYETKEVNGLDKLKVVNGDLEISRTGGSSIPSFTALDTIGGRLSAWDNTNLAISDYTGFNNLRFVGTTATISNWAGVESMELFKNLENVGKGMPGEGIRIQLNPDLTELRGFDNLIVKEVSQFLSITSNPQLSDCRIFCPLIREATLGTAIFLQNNAPGCSSKEEILNTCTPPLRIIDANPRFIVDGWPFPTGSYIRDMNPSEVIALTSDRQYVACDGVTEVCVVAQMDGEGTFAFEYDESVIEYPWGQQAQEVDGKFYAMALILSPEQFQWEEGLDRTDDNVMSSPVSLSGTFNTDEQNEYQFNITTVPPPVVLVHGTFSSPAAWTTAFMNGKSMKSKIAEAGYFVATVDYQNSNGSMDDGSSSFEMNKTMVFDNPGGIDETLMTYRDMGVACTQADIVGHSMGGVLPRVYASPQYNDEYRRDDNFFEGDINRLITIASTHFGAHSGEFQGFMSNLSVLENGFYDALVGTVGSSLGGWYAEAPHSDAVQNQIPGSDALMRVGPTPVPAHAITCRVEYGDMFNPQVIDPDDYQVFYRTTARLMYFFGPWGEFIQSKKDRFEILGEDSNIDGQDWSELRKGANSSVVFSELLDEMQLSLVELAKLFPIFPDFGEGHSFPNNIERFHPDLAEYYMSISDPESWYELFEADKDPANIPSQLFRDVNPSQALGPELDKLNDFVDRFRYLIFDNDHNDGTVRVESQAGQLPEEFVTHLNGVWHGPAPRYESVQNRVVELLNSDLSAFATGFPGVIAGGSGENTHKHKLYFPPAAPEIKRPERSRSEAICHSGMVPSHAEAFARTADAQKTIVITRPVNYDATTLIARSAATKKMDVKPKSSNWGPQKGYLPQLQRYSKIWRVFKEPERQAKIVEYDDKVRENLETKTTESVHLEVTLCGEKFLVYLDGSKGLDDNTPEDDIVLVPVKRNTKVCTWSEDGDEITVDQCDDITDENQLEEFLVMASPDFKDDKTGEPLALTADYDVLMYGEYKGESLSYNPPTDLEFKSGVGQMTTKQEGVMAALNAAVKNTGYNGGNVTHHGPENQYKNSPYVDYPLTAFLPDDIEGVSRGRIVSIPMGPDGFRDVYLKLFVNEMREQGFDLYDNPSAPGWHWTWNEEAEKFELPDSPNLQDYVDELMPVGCGKDGSLDAPSPNCRGVEEMAAQLEPQMIDEQDEKGLVIHPNPAYGSSLNVWLKTTLDQTIAWNVFDQYGNVRASGVSNTVAGDNLLRIDLDQLEPGMYTYSDELGNTGRFLRIR